MDSSLSGLGITVSIGGTSYSGRKGNIPEEYMPYVIQTVRELSGDQIIKKYDTGNGVVTVQVVRRYERLPRHRDSPW